MTSWKLVRDGKDKIRFDYECSDVLIPGSTVSIRDAVTSRAYFTGFTTQGSGEGDMMYLDRHPVMCNEDEFLTKWQVQRNGAGDKIQLAYSCAKSVHYNIPHSCHLKHTPESDEGDGTIYLEGHDVKCDAGYHMKGWMYGRVPPRNFQIEYICCHR